MNWNCHDGRVIAIDKMETGHLRNVIRMLRRKGFISVSEFECYFMAPPQGEMAQMAHEAGFQEACNKPISKELDALEAELKKRDPLVRISNPTPGRARQDFERHYMNNPRKPPSR